MTPSSSFTPTRRYPHRSRLPRASSANALRDSLTAAAPLSKDDGAAAEKGDPIASGPRKSTTGSDKCWLAQSCAQELARRLTALDAGWLCKTKDDDAFEDITSELQRDMTRLVLTLRSERSRTQRELSMVETEREKPLRKEKQARKPPFLSATFQPKQRKPIYHFF